MSSVLAEKFSATTTLGSKWCVGYFPLSKVSLVQKEVFIWIWDVQQ